MEPVFLDFHIHTSPNPARPNTSYDLRKLKSSIEKVADGSPYLISLTDHNFVNKSIYLQAAKEIENILLGVELHIRNYKECKPYHCHIIFNVETIDADVIDDVNVNDALKAPFRLSSFNSLRPESLFKEKFMKRDPKITTYEEFESYVNSRFSGMNRKTYKITTRDGRDFDQLSAGWKTSVILDLVSCNS